MRSKPRGFALAKDISEIMILRRDSREIDCFGSGRSGAEITLLGAELEAELFGTFQATGQSESSGTDERDGRSRTLGETR